MKNEGSEHEKHLEVTKIEWKYFDIDFVMLWVTFKKKEGGTEAIDSVGTFKNLLENLLAFIFGLLGDKQSLIWEILITAK